MYMYVCICIIYLNIFCAINNEHYYTTIGLIGL